MTLSDKIHGQTALAKHIYAEDIKAFIKILKERFWGETEKSFIDKLAGGELI